MFAWAHLPKLARAAGARDPRLVVIVLRGALDGLAAVAPVGDPNYAGLHGQIALSLTGEHPAIPLDGFFALHPAMPVFARLYKEGRAAVVHAAATGLSRALALRRPGRAGKRHPGPGLTHRAGSTAPSARCPRGDRVAGQAAASPSGRRRR